MDSNSDQSADGFEKIALVETAFYKVRIGAHVDPPFAVFPRFEGGDQDHWQLGELAIRADSRGEIEAVEARHLDIRDDEIEGLGAERGEGFHAVHGCLHP